MEVKCPSRKRGHLRTLPLPNRSAWSGDVGGYASGGTCSTVLGQPWKAPGHRSLAFPSFVVLASLRSSDHPSSCCCGEKRKPRRCGRIKHFTPIYRFCFPNPLSQFVLHGDHGTQMGGYTVYAMRRKAHIMEQHYPHSRACSYSHSWTTGFTHVHKARKYRTKGLERLWFLLMY